MYTRYLYRIALPVILVTLILALAACNEDDLDNPNMTGDGDIVDAIDADDVIVDGDATDSPDTDPVDNTDTDPADTPDGDISDGDMVDEDIPDTDPVDNADPDVDMTDGDIDQNDTVDPEPEEDNPPVDPLTQISLSLTETTVLTSSSAGHTPSASAIASASVIRYESVYQNTAEKIGDCHIYPYNGSSTTPAYEALNGGIATITGTLLDPVTLTPSQSAGYGWMYTSNLPAQLTDIYESGASLSMQIAGDGDIPAFSGSVTGVSPIAGLQPPILETSYSYNAGTPLTFTWTTGGADMMIISVTAYQYENYNLVDGVTISCTTDDDGSFEVPAAALARMPDGAGMITLSITRQTYARQQQGDLQFSAGSSSSITRTWSPF